MKHCCCGLSFLLRHLEYVRYPAVPLEEQVPPHFQDVGIDLVLKYLFLSHL